MDRFKRSRSPSPAERPVRGVKQFPLIPLPYMAALSKGPREDMILPMHDSGSSLHKRASSIISLPDGWTSHIHPRGWFYYYNPSRKIVTDFQLEYQFGQDELHASLREDEALEADQLPADCELWVDTKEVYPSTSQTQEKTQRIYIDHQERTATLTPPRRGRYLRPNNRRWTINWDDDRRTVKKLELEQHYWDFMRYHPSHRSLPEYAEDDVVSAMTWCCHNRLLYPEESSVPFSKETSQEILSFLQSILSNPIFSNPRSEPTKVHFVSDILQRIVSERIHTHYRRQDARDVHYALQAGRNYLKRRRATPEGDSRMFPPLRAFWYSVMTVVCFGAPFAYLRYINEFFSGPERTDTIVERWDTFVKENVADWNSTNLVATVLVSAAVAFLAIPGIDGIARLLGIVAVLCAVSSIIIGLLNVWQHQHGSRAASDLTSIVEFFTQAERGVHTYNLLATLLSLPLVLLIWATITFAGGIVTFSWLGVDQTLIDADGGGDSSQQPDMLKSFRFGHPTAWVTTGFFVGLMATAIASFLFFWHVWTPPKASHRVYK